MNLMKKMIRVLTLLLLLALPTSSVRAQGPGGDIVLFGDNYTLEKGETLNGSIAVFGGNISIEEDAVVKGDAALFGGNFQMDGEVDGDVFLFGGNMVISGELDGDVAVFGGQIELTADAIVNGDITTIGGQVKRDPDAQVNGNIVNNAPPIDIPDVPDIPNVPNVPDVPEVPDVPTTPQIDYSFNPLWEGMKTLGFALVVALIAMLLTLFFQTQFERVGDAIVRQPVVAGSFGLLTLVVTPLAMLIMVVTIILIPVAAIVGLLVPLAWLFGVIALGQEVGDRFTKAINQTWVPVLSTGFGTFLLMILGGFIGMVPCIGWLVPFLIALIGIGGVMMTWFGTRTAPGTVQVVEVPPTS